MNIILGSLNPSKKKAIEIALINLGIDNYNIQGFDIKSGVKSQPINEEIMLGASNRNLSLKKHCIENNIVYDYLVSVEGGFSEENGRYYVITCTVIEDSLGIEFTGRSAVLEISRSMFEYVKNGNSLNRLIEAIKGVKQNKQNGGITGYLANNTNAYTRSVIDSVSVMGAFLPFFNREQYKRLDESINDEKVNNFKI